jgi:hypothetical protein
VLGLSNRSGHTPAVLRVVILGTLLHGIAFAQTAPYGTDCILTNGTATGFFGGYNISGSYTIDATPNTSSIVVSGAAYNYTFTGPLNGPGYTETSQIPGPPCDIEGCAPNTFLPPGEATLSVFPNDTNTSAALGFEDTGEIFTGYGTLSCTAAGPPPPPPPPSCAIGAGVTLTGNGDQTIEGSAVPPSGMTLHQVATLCGYIGFNWRQWVTNNPCPSTAYEAVPTSGNQCPPVGGISGGLAVGPQGLNGPPVLDPPPGGWEGDILQSTGKPDTTSQPYYYPTYNAINKDTDRPIVIQGSETINPGPINLGDVELTFQDTPSEYCLPTGPLTQEHMEACGGQDAPGSYVQFKTVLVGINPDNSPGPPLFTWEWQSTFNGTIGGISLLSAIGPPDPGSGVGWITITSINGVPVPPIIPPTQVATTASGLAYSRVTKTFNGTVTVTNTSVTTLTTPTNFQLVLNSLPAGVTLANSKGTFNQCPYITIPTLTSMGPGQSVTVAVQFSNPSNATINFKPEFYAGSFQ